MARRIPALALWALATLGCHDFDADYARCLDAGRCERRDAGSVPVPDGGFRGCADRDNPGNQAFGRGMTGPTSYELFGCVGAVLHSDRQSLCNLDAGCSSPGIQYWTGRASASPAPSHDYWTNDALGLSSGTSGMCSVDYVGVAPACVEADGGASSPMRVCAAAGSLCEVTSCGFQSNQPDFLGGCGGLATASALCACE
jgi:hypothetical protein